MKAVICTKYGPPEVLKLIDVEKPVPKDDEVLIKIHATSCHIGDTRIRGFKVPRMMAIPSRLYLGIFRPKHNILGMELSGEIEAMGKDVTLFKKGDKVYTYTGFEFGAYAEYICLTEKTEKNQIEKKGLVARKPSNITYEEAAVVPAGCMTALSIIKRANIKKEQKVLIYGASGSVGTFAIQLARHYGAEVTGVCSTANLAMVKSLGSRVIDYTKEDFTKNGQTYDFIFDAVGKTTKTQCKAILKENGVYYNIFYHTSKLDITGLDFLKGLIEAGELKPVMDRVYPLEQIAEAHRYVEQGHKKGNVAITVKHD
jgi:NADPH:quinone reductase-like Zn-dependent oxidoreductase